MLVIVGVTSLATGRPMDDEQISSPACDFLPKGSLRAKNCEMIFAQNLIPNREAITFTLGYFRDNTQGLADSSCIDFPESPMPGEEGVSPETLKKGIQNECVFFLHDVTSREKGSSQAQGYLVDLCSRDPSKVVNPVVTNQGVGSTRKGNEYYDLEGENTTVLGAFITAPKLHSFTPLKWSKAYKGLKKKLGGSIPALRIFGVQSSNNETFQGKPMHGTPYNSSFGCPAVGADDVWIMNKLVENGPALVMNYGPRSAHQSTTNCRNDVSGLTCNDKIQGLACDQGQGASEKLTSPESKRKEAQK